MLEGLDKINWAKHKGAYHLKEKLPVYIRDLASSDTERRNKAFRDIGEEINHQGSIYDATPYVVPFLIELLAIDAVQGKDRLLYQLWHVLECCNGSLGYSSNIGDQGIQNCILTYNKIAAGFEVIASFLSHPSIDVRLPAMLMISDLRVYTPRARRLLRQLYCTEPNIELQAIVLVRLGRLLKQGYTPALKTCRRKYWMWFEEIVTSASEPLLRLAAAVAWAIPHHYERRTNVPHLIQDALLWGLTYTPSPSEVSWMIDLHFNPDELLSSIMGLGYEQVTTMLKSPDLAPPQIHKLVRELLDLAFDRKTTRAQRWHESVISWKWWEFEQEHLDKSPKEMLYRNSEGFRRFNPSQKLDKRQQEVIAAIVECDRFWELPTNLFSFFYDLPDSRDALRQLITSP